VRLAAESSRTTHGAATCLDACRYLGGLIVGAARGVGKEELLTSGYAPPPVRWGDNPLHPEIAAIAAGSFKEKQPPAIKGSGFVVRSLEAALWVFYHSDNFRQGCLLAANLGDDADTTAAVYGQLAGAYYGINDIPAEWREQVALREKILELADGLHALADASRE
jgi:ADP-ribosylglycohydrolase